jgi:hypothetical protein
LRAFFDASFGKREKATSFLFVIFGNESSSAGSRGGGHVLYFKVISMTR